MTPERIAEVLDSTTVEAALVGLRELLDALEQERLCDVCLGKPLESGKDCICGGKGTSNNEKVGLRKMVHELSADVMELIAALEQERERGKKLLEAAKKYAKLHRDEHPDWNPRSGRCEPRLLMSCELCDFQDAIAKYEAERGGEGK